MLSFLSTPFDDPWTSLSCFEHLSNSLHNDIICTHMPTIHQGNHPRNHRQHRRFNLPPFPPTNLLVFLLSNRRHSHRMGHLLCQRATLQCSQPTTQRGNPRLNHRVGLRLTLWQHLPRSRRRNLPRSHQYSLPERQLVNHRYSRHRPLHVSH